MKRILLMLVLLMGVVTSAWADKTPQDKLLNHCRIAIFCFIFAHAPKNL